MVNNWDSFYSPLNRVHQKVMANEKGSNVRNIQTGKSTLLPPKIPFPGSSTAYSDYSNNPLSGSNVVLRSKDFNAYHQRASSENLLMEEQPSWLDDLLNEPETPVQRSHRRSSSDSFAYMDVAGGPYMDYASNLHNESRCTNAGLVQLWGSQNMDHFKDIQPGSIYANSYSAGKPRNRIWEWPLTSATRPGTLPSLRDNIIFQSVGPSSAPQKTDSVPLAIEKQGNGESGLPDAKPFLENYDGSQTKIMESDTKRAKQQFAQRSRVRKLQYISELERNVQAIQAEGSEVSAELDFLNQQNLILSMENKALKQRLESLAQEQLIKHLEHEMLEREIARLRAVYQQQLQPPPLQQQNNKQLNLRQTSSTHKRANSKDLDSQFANLSLKHKDASSSTDAVHI